MDENIKSIYLGFLMQFKGDIIVLQKKEQIENASITYLASLHGVPAPDLARAIEIVVERLKNPPKTSEDA
jgi:hypothetical protein